MRRVKQRSNRSFDTDTELASVSLTLLPMERVAHRAHLSSITGHPPGRPMDTIVRGILGRLVERALAHTGRFAIWVATMGRWRAERFEEGEGQSVAPNAALYFRRRGECVVTTFGCMLSGIALYVVLGLALYALSR
jgi:hypothetical protein